MASAVAREQCGIGQKAERKSRDLSQDQNRVPRGTEEATAKQQENKEEQRKERDSRRESGASTGN